MSQTEKVVATLQTLATGATGQATHHDIAAQIFASQGFTKLSDKYTGHATEKRDFAGRFMARILDLDGNYNTQPNPHSRYSLTSRLICKPKRTFHKKASPH